jgi:hypothetical protein
MKQWRQRVLKVPFSFCVRLYMYFRPAMGFLIVRRTSILST